MSGSKDDSTNPVDEAEKAASEVDEIIENTEQGEGDIFDDLFNDIDDLVEELTEGEVGAEEDNPKEAAVASDDTFDLENLEEIDADTYIEPVIEKKEWEPEPIPEATKSLSASLWDNCPRWTRKMMIKWGVEPPLDARKIGSIHAENFLGMGSKGAMLLGPASAGKTTLIAAINRACLIPVESDIDLRWRASGDEDTQYKLTDLLDKAIRQILQEDDPDATTIDEDTIKATNEHGRYDFTIEGRAKAERHFNGSQIFDMKLAFHDAPGEAMFTTKRSVWDDQQPTRQKMLSEAKGSYTLIFCFDGSARQARMMQSSLARILPLLQSKRHGGYIIPMRVLVLLNKIDQVCDDFYTKLAKEFPSLIDNPTITPETIAEDLDPLAMAIECLGYESLKSLRDAMRPDAELAVGVISTWGFNYEGKPLVGANGRPNFLTMANRGHGNDFVSQWRPYGIREALIYLATGRGSSNLHIMSPDDFNQTMYAPRSIHLQNQPPKSTPRPSQKSVNQGQSKQVPAARQRPNPRQAYPNRQVQKPTSRRPSNQPKRRQAYPSQKQSQPIRQTASKQRQAYPNRQSQNPNTGTSTAQQSKQPYPNRAQQSRSGIQSTTSQRQAYPNRQPKSNAATGTAKPNSRQAYPNRPSQNSEQRMSQIPSRHNRGSAKSPYSRNKRR